MRQSDLRGKRLKESPAEASLDSHVFLLRGGYVRQVAGGIYSLLHPGLRVVRKIERIIREEMNRIGGQEVLMPVVLPGSLWEESGRAATVGAELARFTDRAGQPLLLGMTHEEAVVHLFRNEVESYRDLPFLAYQIQTKFRDEPRSRGGLIRVREFTMKDAYSFHVDQADLEAWYERCREAYVRIFARAGIPETVVVASDSGMMGGAVAHEFMLLCDAGEDTIVTCPACGYHANREVAEGRLAGHPGDPAALERVHTPGQQTIEEVARFLGVEARQTAKAVFYHRDEDDRPVLAVIRGDLEINEAKLARVIRAEPVIAEHDRIRAVGAVPGYASALAVSPSACRVVVDHSIAGSANLVCGANEVDHHYLNFNLERDLPDQETVDIARVRGGDGCPRCEGALELERGIEVGNIFQLGDRYTAAMGMSYLDEQGRAGVPIMGCYGIGVGRLLAAVIEARHDAHGPIWPLSIAPWQVHLCALKLDQPQVAAAADALYRDLAAVGVEVLYDDRNERPGVQFADADLLGIPLRLVVSPRNLKESGVELIRRGERRGDLVPLREAVSTVRARIAADE
jgi:prolyl-tRNA synthetase